MGLYFSNICLLPEGNLCRFMLVSLQARPLSREAETPRDCVKSNPNRALGCVTRCRMRSQSAAWHMLICVSDSQTFS